ncbi:MAG: hypothetical protein D6786_08480 [Gammaproteobacteria bacterium]|nr:MAG: hypothetical protein D6786_08480 [Gammaproteobacteria bacterium]
MAEDQTADFVTALDQIASHLSDQRVSAESPRELMQQQLLYEKWTRREEWSLRSEAVPLLLAIEPEEWGALLSSPGLASAEEVLWGLVEQAAAQGQLPLLNPAEDSAFWRVAPRDIYLWARARGIALPPAFDQLMSFIISVVPAEIPGEPVPGGAGPQPSDSSERETVLGAALALLANVPANCRDGSGWVTGEALARQIIANQALWFDHPPQMGPEEMARFLDRWLDSMGGDAELPF